jgi:Tol biopolymer transport system component
VKKRPTYLELGRRQAFGRPSRRAPLGPVAPPPDPATVADFDLGTWRVRPALARMTSADRIVALEPPTLLALLILAERPPGGVNRDQLAARIYGGGMAEDHEPKLRRVLGFLRRVFSEDGSVRIENAPGDAYVLEVGSPVPGRGLKAPESTVLREDPGGVSAWLGRKRRRGLAIGVAALIVVLLAGGLTVLIERSHVVLFGTVSKVVAFATEPGVKTSPSFSPDGRQVVYSWRLGDGSGTHLVLRPVGGGSWRPLTAGPGTDLYPAWSPHGNLIAFERLEGADCGVFVIAPDGGTERRLGDCGFGAEGHLTWTREGEAVIFSHRGDTIRSRQLVSAGVASGTLTGVSNPVMGMPGDQQPVLAPTGRRLVFVRSRAVGVSDIQLLDLGTVAVERVTRDGTPIDGIAFEGGTQSVVFASGRGGRMALWRTRLDRWKPDLMLATANELRGPAISADGKRMAFEEWRYTSALVRLPGAAEGAPLPLRDDGDVLMRDPQLSPDGSVLVYVSNAGGHDALWLAPAGGGPARALTHAGLDVVESPHWSSDGRTIAFTGYRDGHFDIWTVPVAGGEPRRASDDGMTRAPSFSHDGRWLYFASQRAGGHWQIWRQAWPDGGHAEQLTTLGGLAALEAPDGDSLYYVRPDRPGLWHRPREPDGDDTLASPELSPADWHNFDVGTDAVWFVARGDVGAPELMRYSTNREESKPVRPLPGALPGLGIAATPDGIILPQVTSVSADLRLATLD